MDQVKLRCMLGQLGRSLGPYSKNKFFKKGIGKNPKARVNQQVTKENFFRISPSARSPVRAAEKFSKEFSMFFLRKNIGLKIKCRSFKYLRYLNLRDFIFSAKVFKKTDGTSETTREAVSSFNFSDYEKHKPKHIKNIDPLFLQWFIGFFEGDGSFIARHSTGSNGEPLLRINFEITQSIRNVKLLRWIRKELGFGKVIIFEKDDLTYARWFTSERKHVLALLALFNGNFILPKRQEQFESIISQLNSVWNCNFEIKPWKSQLTLDNAWLGGFSDADAGFFTNIQNNFKGHRKSPDEFYYRLLTKFFVTQDGDDSFLKTIQQLVGDTSKIYQISSGNNNTKKYNRLEISSIDATEKLINYFVRFPLKGERRISFLRWARVYGYKKRGLRLNESSASKLVRLINNLLPEDSPLENFVVTTKHVLEYFDQDEI